MLPSGGGPYAINEYGKNKGSEGMLLALARLVATHSPSLALAV